MMMKKMMMMLLMMMNDPGPRLQMAYSQLATKDTTTLPVLLDENPPVNGGSPERGPALWTLMFSLMLNDEKESGFRWLETPVFSCNVTVLGINHGWVRVVDINSRVCCLAAPGDPEGAARGIAPRRDNTLWGKYHCTNTIQHATLKQCNQRASIMSENTLFPIISYMHVFTLNGSVKASIVWVYRTRKRDGVIRKHVLPDFLPIEQLLRDPSTDRIRRNNVEELNVLILVFHT